MARYSLQQRYSQEDDPVHANDNRGAHRHYRDYGNYDDEQDYRTRGQSLNEYDMGNEDYDNDMRFGRSGIERTNRSSGSDYNKSGRYSSGFSNRSAESGYGRDQDYNRDEENRSFGEYGNRYGRDYDRENYAVSGNNRPYSQYDRGGNNRSNRQRQRDFSYGGSSEPDYDIAPRFRRRSSY